MYGHNDLGAIYAKTGEAKRGDCRVFSGSSLGPDNIGNHYNLGRVYMRLGRVDEAKGEFEAVLRLNPGDAGARQVL